MNQRILHFFTLALLVGSTTAVDGGVIIFQDTFESGNLSQWHAAQGVRRLRRHYDGSAGLPSPLLARGNLFPGAECASFGRDCAGDGWPMAPLRSRLHRNTRIKPHLELSGDARGLV